MSKRATIAAITWAVSALFLALPLRAADYLRAANTLYESGELGAAALYLEAALDEEPECVDCWLLLGYCRYYRGQLKKAMLAYKKILEFSPGRDDVKVLVADLEEEIKQSEKAGGGEKEGVRRRRSGWGVLLGMPSGVNFARRLQEIYMVSLLLGSRFDNQIAFNADVFARFPVGEAGASYISFGLGWCTLAGGSETVGRTYTGKILKVARKTRAGPNLPFALSFFFGRTEIYLQGSTVIALTPERKLIPCGGIGVRWYIEGE